jgi:hypothetical protein
MLQSLVVLRSDLTALSINPPAAATTTTATTGTPTSAEYKVPDAIFVHILLCTLPDYYDPFHQTLINSSTTLNFNDIVNHLKTQELHRTNNSGGAEHTAMFSGHRSAPAGPSRGDRVAPKGFDEMKGDGWVLGWRPKCGHCVKAGHIWAQCRAHCKE